MMLVYCILFSLVQVFVLLGFTDKTFNVTVLTNKEQSTLSEEYCIFFHSLDFILSSFTDKVLIRHILYDNNLSGGIINRFII